VAVTAISADKMTATMQENVELYPCAVYAVGSTGNPLSAAMQALGVYASYLGRRGKTTISSTGVQAIAFLIPMVDANYNIQLTFVDTDGVVVPGVVADFYRTGTGSDRTANGFNVTVNQTGTLIWWCAKETD
jgi:hypothetical protein